MNKKLAAAMVTLLTLGMTASVAAQGTNLEGDDRPANEDSNKSETADITVGISSTTAIDVKPNQLDFQNLEVGTQTTQENDGGNEFGSFSLENIGSEYIDLVWATASHPNSDPFGTGISGNYDAGNFLQLKPGNTARAGVPSDTADSNYHYVNRYEFANSWSNSSNEIPTYIRADPANVRTSAPTDTYVGRIQAGDEWYFYTVVPSSGSSTCTGGNGAELRVGNAKHSSSAFGTVDFTDDNQNDDGSTGYTTYSLQTTSGDYGLTTDSISLDFQVDSSPVTRTYDFLTRCDPEGVEQDDPHVIRTRYNVQAGDIADLNTVPDGTGTSDNAGVATRFLLNPSSDGADLLPGEHLAIDAAIEVPQGVPEGSVSDGLLTFYVTSDDDAQTS